MIQTVTTTQIQRKPSILQMKESDDYKYVIKNGEIISIIASPKYADKIVNKPNKKELTPEKIAKLKNIWKKVDPIAYQEEMRKEE